MKEYQSLNGRRYGMLVVVEQSASSASGKRRWLCRCDCGGTYVTTTGNLNSGRATNCGCKKSPDLTGRVFGKLTVLGRSDKRNSRGARTTPMWECRCECGNITYKATDTLKASGKCMCLDCNGRYGAEKARENAGYVGGTQLTKIIDMKPTAANTSGVRGVQYDKRTNRYRARLKFKGKLMNFGSYRTLEEAVTARRAAEQEYYGSFLEELGYEKEVANEEKIQTDVQ